MDGARAMRLSAGFLIPFYGQVAGDGCSEMCQCEADPCDFAASPSVHLASVVLALRPGATLSLAAGTYMGSGSCGWSIATTVSSADDRSLPITVRGAQGAIIDCDNVGPVVEDMILGAHLRLGHPLYAIAEERGKWRSAASRAGQ